MSEREEQAPGASPVAMVDRVARAIAGQLDGELDDGWRAKARAGIAAMREPTPAMVEAGDAVERSWEYADNGSREYSDLDPAEAWRAMIDEALKP